MYIFKVFNILLRGYLARTNSRMNELFTNTAGISLKRTLIITNMKSVNLTKEYDHDPVSHRSFTSVADCHTIYLGTLIPGNIL